MAKIRIHAIRSTQQKNVIEDPLGISQVDVEAWLAACIGEMFKLRKDAPKVCRKHLLEY